MILAEGQRTVALKSNPEKQGKNKEVRRRRREIILIGILLVLTALLFYLQTHVTRWGDQVPVTNNILVLSLIGLNIILLLLMVFLILRNVVKLVFERKKRILGAKLKTKLVLAFTTLSLLPTIVLFFIATHFITGSMKNWFSTQVEESLQQSLVVAQVYYQKTTNDALHYGRQISQEITRQQMIEKGNPSALAGYLTEKVKEFNLGALEILTKNPSGPTLIHSATLQKMNFPPIETKILQEALQGKESTKIQSVGPGDLIRGLVPISSSQNPKEVISILVVDYFVPQSLVARINEISMAFEDYKQLRTLKNPIKSSYIITLSLVTLLIIFSATWFGLFLAKGITEPILRLAEGTQKITKGNLDFQIAKTSEDEIGTLVNSFNQMTQDLKGSKSQVEAAHAELSRSNLELEERRRYMEIVLRDVGAGVISIDAEGRIRTINKSAEKILGIQAEGVLGQNYKEVLPPEQLALTEVLAKEVNRAENYSFTREVKLSVRNEILTLLVKIALLRDDEKRYLGVVVVLDDLTQLQKAQRAAAWREVARRIAHEIKNPLTPIQLSAQRLRKRYMSQFMEDGAVFDESTKTIITQVEEIKNLVNEFSSFARMPAANPIPSDLNEIIREAFILYQEAHRQISFVFKPDPKIPVFNLDKEQIKRVIVNLLENAVAAVEEKTGGGEITIETQLDPLMSLARIEVADNGCGIAMEDKPLLFEPYFSTKIAGTGLGLAIANTIISDHDGYIRVKDNMPQGARFIIEIPIKQ